MVIIRGKEYSEVKDRIAAFWEDHKPWSLITELVSDVADMPKWVCFKASILNDARTVVSTGYAYEERIEPTGGMDVNATSWVENCETSAIGRALANLNYAGSERPSAEEVRKADRMKGGKTAPKIDLLKTGGRTEKSKEELVEEVGGLFRDIRHISGSDMAHTEALGNRNVKAVRELKVEELKELTESLSGFKQALLDLLEESTGKKNQTHKSLSPDQDKGFQELVAKMTLTL